MKKSTIFSLLAAAGCIMAGSAQASAQTFMEEATLDYPSGLYTSFAPSSVSITWDNQPFELINPDTDEYGDQYVDTYVQLGDGEKQAVKAYVLYSFGDPENPDDHDIWNLDIALYDIEDLWSFDGNTVTVIIPEGIVKNEEGAINPAQDFVFVIMPTYTDYTLSPESGSTLDADNLIVKIGFGDNPIKYLQAEVSARVYDPVYKEITLEYGKDVTIVDNELVIDLSSLDEGEYEIIVPEGYLIITENEIDHLSPDIWLEYTITKESSVASLYGEKHFDVYSLQGIRVMSTDNTSALRQLPEGIYIINGKKTYIRK